jgi:hypothetical protein
VLSDGAGPKLSLKGALPEADSRSVNVILVPALLLLVGLAVYKKVIEPKRSGERPPKAEKVAKASKPGKAPNPGKEPKPAKAPKASSKARPTVSSGRMGSVL